MKKKWFVAITASLFFMPIVAIGVLNSLNTFQVKELPIISQIPDFQLTERSGKSIGLKDLFGKVWIASFIFTSCSGQCPMISQSMRRLQHSLRHRTEVRFLSFTVDPERDNESVLEKYAAQFEADPMKWFFVTGKKDLVSEVVRKGFKLILEDGTPETEQVMHSFKLALVDPWGRVRGYYDAGEESQMKALIKDTRRLIKKAF